MANLQDTITEGVKKKITINSSVDTDGDTVKLYAFVRGDKSDTGTLLGSEAGVAADSDIIFSSTNTHELKAGRFYYIEAWVEPDDANRKLIYPSEDDTHLLRILDRYKVDV